MIAKALELLPAVEGWCVEFGAWDGRRGSNTHRLMTEEGWSGVFIEADERRFRELQHVYAGNDRAFCLNAYVDLDGGLNELLSRTPLPNEFDLLSIDIDGNDWHAWRSLSGSYRPKLVVVEFNATIPADIDFVQPAEPDVHQASSLAAFCRLGKAKGYELVATSDWNAFFVRADLFPLFEIEENSPSALLSPQFQTRVFQLFDGTLCWDGCTRLIWHGLDLRRQPLHKPVRHMPGYEPDALHRWLRRLYVTLRRRRLNRGQ